MNRVGSVNRQLLFQIFQVLAEVLVCLAKVVHRAASMEHGGVVLAATVQANVGQRRLRHLLGEVHGDLTCLHDFSLPRLAFEKLDGQVEVIAHHLLDVVDAHLTGCVLDELVNHVLGQVQGDGLAVEACLGNQ